MSINMTGGSIFDRVIINKNVVNGIGFSNTDVEMMKKTVAAKIMKLPVEESLQILGSVKQPEEAVNYTFYAMEKKGKSIEVATIEEVKHFQSDGWVVTGTVLKKL